LPRIEVEGAGAYDVEEGKRLVLAIEEDAGVNHGLQALDYLVRGADHELLGVLRVALGTAGLLGGRFGVLAGLQEVDVYAGRAGDVFVGAVLVLAVAL
jgi:hypothetical protein